MVHLGKNGGASVCPETDRLGVVSRDAGANHSAGSHETVSVFSEGGDAEVDTLETGGRSHEEAVVKCQHYSAAGLAVEDPRHAVLDPPVSAVEAFEVKGIGVSRCVEAEVIAVSDVV